MKRTIMALAIALAATNVTSASDSDLEEERYLPLSPDIRQTTEVEPDPVGRNVDTPDTQEEQREQAQRGGCVIGFAVGVIASTLAMAIIFG
jgi:hypothetical protein